MASPYDNIPGKIFIGGISPLTSQESIQKYFGKFGDLSDCVLMQDKSTGKSRGFGFVTYKDSRVVDDVLSKPHIIDGKEVDCKRAIPRDQQNETPKEETVYKTKKLFVGGIPQNTTEDEFRNYFEGFGDIEDSVIMVDKETGKSRGFGFVTFDSEDAVEKVINKYYDNKIGGKWVECKRAQPKEVNTSSAKKATPSKQSKENGLNTSGFTSQTTNSQNNQTSNYQNTKTVQTPQKTKGISNTSRTPTPRT
jgi:RNA recognition motif-containing protein